MEFLNQYNPSLSNYQLFISLIKEKVSSFSLLHPALCCVCRVVGEVRGDNGSWWFIWHILYISFFYFLSKNKHRTEKYSWKINYPITQCQSFDTGIFFLQPEPLGNTNDQYFFECWYHQTIIKLTSLVSFLLLMGKKVLFPILSQIKWYCQVMKMLLSSS